MKKRYYTWQDVEQTTESIVLQMYKDSWRPDYIVGITRGGLCLATMLSHKLDVRLETLKVKLRDAEEGESCETNCWMADDAFGYVSDQETYNAGWDLDKRKKILIVDDINDTGATFDWIKKDWQSSCSPNEESWKTVWGNSVRFAVMTENLSSNFSNTNYYWDEVNKAEEDLWLVWPWEYEVKKGE